MYKAEKINDFDSWNQDDVSLLDKQICLKIVKELSFNTLLDVGCGKGALPIFLKEKIIQFLVQTFPMRRFLLLTEVQEHSLFHS